MTRRDWPKALPAAVGAVLCLLLLIALLRGPEWHSPSGLEQAGDADTEDAGEAGEDAPAFDPPPAAGFDVVVARNLFSIERTPPADDSQPSDRPQAEAQADAESSQLSLTGVIRTETYAAAILQDGGSGETVRLKPGERYRGWTLRTLDATSATLQRPDEEITLYVLFSPETEERDSDAGRTRSRGERLPLQPRRGDEQGNPVPAARQRDVNDSGG